MIYYFSGTGNSKAIAEEIADYIGTKAVDIIGVDIDQIHLAIPPPVRSEIYVNKCRVETHSAGASSVCNDF